MSKEKMGFEDRDYYQDSYQRQSFGGGGFDMRSMVMTIILINVAVFVLDMFTPYARISNPQAGQEVTAVVDGQKVIFIAPEFIEDKTQWLSCNLSLNSKELWKFWGILTHGFAHASFMTEPSIFHILMNMVTLFFLGRPVEHRLGREEFLRFYLWAIVISGLGWLAYALVIGPGGFVVGASGAVSAVIAYFVFMAPQSTLYLMGVVPVKAWILGILFLATNLIHALDPAGHIAWQAHLVGAGFGMLYFKNNWNLSRFDLGISKLLNRKPRLNVHNPDAGSEKLKAQADEVLAKINEQGESALTRKERKILNQYSKSIRKNRN